jgi:hypothetical protein
MNSLERNKMLENLPPPVPSKRGDGNFEYVDDKIEKEILENAFKAISLTNLWDFVSKNTESFMWSEANEIEIISNKMGELGYNGHSGFSFAWTMRAMQYLAQHGEDEFKSTYYKMSG